MQKSAPSLGRILIMVGFALSCFGLLLFLWLAFGGPVPLKPKGYRLTVSFKEAGQLSQEADVRISGVSVGKVKVIKSDKSTGLSDATIELDKQYAPLPRDTRAILRQKTLLGETYVELTPGNRSGPKVPDGGRLPAGQVAPTVELDEIFRAFDPKTRAAFRDWMQQQALAATGRGRDISDAIGNLRPFAEDTSVLLKILNGQEPTVRALVRDSGTVFTALSERDGQLRGLIDNSNRVFATTAQRNQQLRETFRALPTFEKESKATVERLTSFSKNANPLVTQLRPAARQMSPTLQDLAALSPDLKAFFRNLDPAITASKTGLPAMERFLRELQPTLGELDPPLQQLAPALAGLGQYKSELTAFLANVPAATQAVTVDSHGNRIHYLRTTNPLNAENLAVYPKRLPSNRTNPYPLPRLFDQLPTGMSSYETRQCTGGGMPTVSDSLTNLIPAPLRDNIVKYAFGGGGGVVAPACKQQPKFPVFGEVTQFPHVNENRLLDGKPFSPGR
jgi:phospholipid/cholesterol/gamma-HCH transport system substrate-binding protein